MNKWLLILHDSDGDYIVSAYHSRKLAEAVATQFRQATILAIVIDLDELVKTATA